MHVLAAKKCVAFVAPMVTKMTIDRALNGEKREIRKSTGRGDLIHQTTVWFDGPRQLSSIMLELLLQWLNIHKKAPIWSNRDDVAIGGNVIWLSRGDI